MIGDASDGRARHAQDFETAGQIYERRQRSRTWAKPKVTDAIFIVRKAVNAVKAMLLIVDGQLSIEKISVSSAKSQTM